MRQISHDELAEMPDLTDDPIVDTMDPIAANRSSTKVSKPMFLL